MKTGTTSKFAAGLFILALLSISAGVMAAGPAGVGSGLAMWLDAQSLGLSNGDLVNTWTDQSGLGNDATAYSWAGWQPEYVTNAINGQAAVRFGTNASSQLKTASGILSGSKMTAFVVYKDRAPAYGQGIIDFGGVELLDWANGWGTCEQYGTWVGSMAGPMIPTSGFGLQTFQFNGASSFAKINGSLPNSAAPYNGLANMSYPSYSIAGAVWIGARENTTGVAPVDISEVIIYNRALSADEESNVGAYLASKYGLSTSYVSTNVPEPGTLSILAIGVLPLVRRRRK